MQVPSTSTTFRALLHELGGATNPARQQRRLSCPWSGILAWPLSPVAQDSKFLSGANQLYAAHSLGREAGGWMHWTGTDSKPV